jgi:hypothetical protein
MPVTRVSERRLPQTRQAQAQFRWMLEIRCRSLVHVSSHSNRELDPPESPFQSCEKRSNKSKSRWYDEFAVTCSSLTVARVIFWSQNPGRFMLSTLTLLAARSFCSECSALAGSPIPLRNQYHCICRRVRWIRVHTTSVSKCVQTENRIRPKDLLRP